MKKIFSLIMLGMIFALGLSANSERLLNASNSLQDILDLKKVPKNLIRKSAAIVVFPTIHQGGFFVGGMGGKGVVVRRTGFGWSKPLSINIKGGSLGLQFGYQQGSMVFFVLNKKIAKDMMSRKITLDVDASITLWDFGDNYSDSTDFKLTSDIYVFTKNRGVFAGVSFGGAVVNVDNVQLTNTPYALKRWNKTLSSME